MASNETLRGEVVPSVETDETRALALLALNRADDAKSAAEDAYDFAQTVNAAATNAQTSAASAITLATAAQTTADNAIATQVSVSGGTLTGPLFLYNTSPVGSTEAAAKGYVDTKVLEAAGDYTSGLALKADKTYVDAADASLQSQITSGAASITDLYTKIIPVGAIIMWSGTVATIPSGWVLCNGLNGTPDLRNRFIIGAGSTFTPGNTGGSTTLTVSSSGAHSHSVTTSTAGDHTHTGTITIADHVLSVAHLPAHEHRNGVLTDDVAGVNIHVYGHTTTATPGSASQKIVSGTSGSGLNSSRQGITQTVGSGQAVTHTVGASISNAGGHTHIVSFNGTDGLHSHTASGYYQPYYALCFIMKV